MTPIFVTWSEFKEFLSTRKIDFNVDSDWILLQKLYFIRVSTGLFVVECRLDTTDKGQAKDVDDFEQNYKKGF